MLSLQHDFYAWSGKEELKFKGYDLCSIFLKAIKWKTLCML